MSDHRQPGTGGAADRPRTAAVLLIGNELLSGRVRDENLGFLAAELWQLGVAVERAEVVGDDPDQIAAALRRLSPAHGWVFTTGGIGPTHDDVTIDGVARCFEREITFAPELERMIRAHFGAATTAAHLRMARVPLGAELEGAEDGNWPTIVMQNVVVLPGVPLILRRKFSKIRERFRAGVFFRKSRTFRAYEADLAPLLERLVEEHPAVAIGSYPQEDEVLITLESRALDAVQAALERLDQLTAALDRG